MKQISLAFSGPLILALLVSSAGCAPATSEDSLARGTVEWNGKQPRTRTIETDVLPIDRIYKSMQGPYAWADVDATGLDWVTAYRTEVVDAETGEDLGGEFFCHSSLQQLNFYRVFVNATGTEDLVLPEGFGMPLTQVLSGLPPAQRKLRALGMVLNNHDQEMDRKARVRVTLEYFTEEDLAGGPPLAKLYNTGLTLSVQDLEAYRPDADPESLSNDDLATHCTLVNGFEGHWMVPPGPQTTRQRYAGFLPVDGTVHYIVVHLHNYGRYMRLTDVTTGEILWQAEPRYDERMQIVEIPPYSSAEGFPIHADHEYEIEAFYDNTTDHDVDAMAMMSIFYNPTHGENIIYPHGPGMDEPGNPGRM